MPVGVLTGPENEPRRWKDVSRRDSQESQKRYPPEVRRRVPPGLGAALGVRLQGEYKNDGQLPDRQIDGITSDQASTTSESELRTKNRNSGSTTDDGKLTGGLGRKETGW